MHVWIARWDLPDFESGVEVFASQTLAVEAALGYAQEMSLIGPQAMAEAMARKQLLLTGELGFEDMECYYWVEEHEVRTLPT